METPQMGVEATATFEGGPPSALALRKALQALGSIESIRQGPPGILRLQFKDVLRPLQEHIIAIDGKPVSIKPASTIHSRGTIFRDELALWTLEELQAELGSSAKVLRRLATRQQAADHSGRILLGFATTNPPAEVRIQAMNLSLSVQKYVPGPTRCRRCHRLRHSERACGHPPRCGRCGSPEHTRENCKSSPRCPMCKGPHEATEPSCPAWAQERKRLQEAILGKPALTNPARSPAPPALSSQLVFPTLTLKRAGPSPPPPPASKRWASPSPSPSPAPVASAPTNPDILRILENQGRMLEQLMRTNESILQLLLRLVPAPAAAGPAATPTPADGPASAITPTSAVPQISVGTEQQPAADPTPKRSPKTRGEKGKLAVKIPQTRSPVYSLGKDPASPLASNVATYDFKEQ